MHKHPKFSQLIAFHEIARYGSIRAAAKVLCQSQPAVTRTLRELEDNLGVALVNRSYNGITLTELGKVFAMRTKFVLEEMQRAGDELDQLSSHMKGRIAFGYSSLFAFSILPNVINEFRRRCPFASVALNEGQLSTLLVPLREGQLDFAIGTLSPDIPLKDFIEEPLFTTSFRVLARKNHPLSSCTRLADLKDASWIISRSNMGYYHQLDSLMSPLQGIRIQTDSIVSAFNVMLSGDFLSIMASAMAPPQELKNQLCALPIEDSIPDATYYLIYPRKIALTETARIMIDIIRKYSRSFQWEPVSD